ncbi:MAG: DinB family protein [Cryomorphaceae bacterium]|nr:DinB family protein [Cryomorphaceae bacterium]
MRYQTEKLLQELEEMTRKHLNEVAWLLSQNADKLNQKPNPDAWSALECIEHLNRYGDFYLPEVEAVLRNAPRKPAKTFKSGFLGNKFAKMMLPSENMKKMKTFKDKDPAGSDLTVEVLEKFKDQLFQWLNIFDECKKVNLTKVKTSISISKWIKLRLGDTLRVVVYHNERHVRQGVLNGE